ncbi:MAG: signal peptidase II [Proteobacteria bacterium]|nr:MAG: signal peptidase II [Pseudomonadota bacterium]PIE68110.1 MAG: signal peptidase II [Deltaproteobacteria bacterium]
MAANRHSDAHRRTSEPFPGAEVREPSLGFKPFVLIAALVVILDQITKYLILVHLPLYRSITVIPGFFNLTHIRNPGGAFGFMAGGSQGMRSLLFIGVSLLAIGLIVYFYRNTPRTFPCLASALAMIFGGAVGNLVDRFRFGEVVDFLDVYVGPHHWPAFNVADSAITVGITVFAIHVVLGKMPE